MTHAKASPPLSEDDAIAANRMMALANVQSAQRYLDSISQQSSETANPNDVRAADLLDAAACLLARNRSP